MDKRRLVILVMAILTLSLLAPSLTAAQGSVGDYGKLSDADRSLFVAGYVNGFAVAAQLPSGRAPLLQECFKKWDTNQVHTIIESWILRHPAETKNPQYTARIAIFSALAEACGWKNQ